MNDEQAAKLATTVIDHLADMVVVLDQAGTIRYANARTEQLLGRNRADWIGRPVFELIHPDDLTLALELFVSTQAIGSGVQEPAVYRVLKADGSWLSVEVISSNIDLGDGELALALACRASNTRRPDLEIVNDAGERLARMFLDAAIGMTQTGLDGRLLRVNPSFATMLGYTPADLVGWPTSEFTHPDERHSDRELFARVANGTAVTSRRSTRYVAVDGRAVHVDVTASLVRDRHGSPFYCATQTIDVTALKEIEAELVHRSTHDPLTGLANRLLLHAVLDEALVRAARRNEAVAILFLDLDGFKAINDTHGHAVGDAMLVEVARRLRQAVRTSDVVCRYGGDEFVVFCEFADHPGVTEIANRILHTVTAPYQLGPVSAVIGVSIGIAVEDAVTVSADDLLRRADTALYQAKTNGRGQIRTHTNSIPTGHQH